MRLGKHNMQLTQKQRKFCDNIMNGMSQVNAYLDAYDAQNMARNTAYVKASELAKNGKIRAKIELFRQLENQRMLELRREQTIILVELLNKQQSLKTKGRFTQMIRIIKLLNRMYGYNKPEKIENKPKFDGVKIIVV